ncbi:MAG: type VI secretion system contractile sheath small subunit [Planctomycetota bacterium]
MSSIYDEKRDARPPRVHITYDVETGGAEPMKELPFVVGVLADLQGDTPPDKKLKDVKRIFKEIDRDNFDEVLAGLAPTLKNLRTENHMTSAGGEISFELQFKERASFTPDSVVQNARLGDGTYPLRELLEVRNQLKDLLNRASSNDRVDEVLDEILKNEALRGKVHGLFEDAPSETGKPPAEAAGDGQAPNQDPETDKQEES